MDNSKNSNRSSTTHIPKFYNTESNKKFLSSTFDRLIQPGLVEKINGYIGRTHTQNYKYTDYYLKDVSANRKHKQLEPASVIIDELDNVSFYKDYNDFINGLSNNHADTSNESRINSQEYYAWSPSIDWDKLVNYHQYYWLPDGPPAIFINNIGLERSCTTDVSYNNGFTFSSYEGVNPTLVLYRNLSYTFNINTDNIPFSIRETSDLYSYWNPYTNYKTSDLIIHNHIIYECIDNHTSTNTFDDTYWANSDTFTGIVSKQDVSKETITITLPESIPDILYYVSDQDTSAGGMIIVKDLDNATLNIETDIIGKKYYYIDDKTELSNGMKLTFGDNTYPKEYQHSSWIVTGVGDSIKLVDSNTFCNQCNKTIPDYITIGIGATNGNLWSRNNRWCHKSVIKKSYEYNNQFPFYDFNNRAKRPIIEFDVELQLFNHGTYKKYDVDLIDDFTTDIFSTVEASLGYNIDGINVTDGMKILFTNDSNEKNNNKIYKIQMIPRGEHNAISLVEVPGSQTEVNHTVYAKFGVKYGEKLVWRSESGWKTAQTKTKPNQEPLFMVYDNEHVPLDDNTKYPYSSFNGTKLFSYKHNNDTIDSVLNFGITYQSIENIGDIVFSFDYNNQTYSFRDEDEKIITYPINIGYLRKYNTSYSYTLVKDFVKAHTTSKQPVSYNFLATQAQEKHKIDITTYPVDISNEDIIVHKNSLLLDKTQYRINKINSSNYVVFNESLDKNDNISLKINTSNSVKDDVLFDIPINLSNNPSNEELHYLTYSEIMNHVRSIVENIDNFTGSIPGNSNLRDLGKVSPYGTKIIKNTSPLNVIMYHLLSEKTNIIDAIDFCKTEYGKFKREFIRLATEINLNGGVKEQVDELLKHINKGKTKYDPFYFSDMVPYSSFTKKEYVLSGSSLQYFALDHDHILNEPSSNAVSVYVNNEQLIINKDYYINDDGFMVLSKSTKKDDLIEIYEYQTTNGSFVPITPSKLGLYPSSIPKKIIDDTYLEPQEVIIGHDGSVTIAYNDYRDGLLLELEKRIFNNIKIKNSNFNIYEYLPGKYRDVGITKQSFEKTMLNDFKNWSFTVKNDYSINDITLANVPFSYNYTGSIDTTGKVVSGTWKALYKHAYDTISPHITPWEMLGYHIQPSWWDSVYGVAPYTNNNLVLWEDIENGTIREPNNVRQNSLYKRPGIRSHIPVNENGVLLDPITSNFINTMKMGSTTNNFIYGDCSPVELAWKNNSEYRFSLIKSLILNFSSSIFSVGFDLMRQKRDQTGMLKYENKLFSAKNIIFPSSGHDSEQIHTSGLINFMREAYVSEKNNRYSTYKNELNNIETVLGAKLAGFTSNDKITLSFDSKKPSKNNSMIIPDTNYSIFLNKSTPISKKNYSGIIIEKHPSGFLINGYNFNNPVIEYSPYVGKPDDQIVNIGGTSEPFFIWENDKTYSIGNIVKYQDTYYRVTKYHTTSSKFDSSNYASMPFLPIVGGHTVTLRSEFHDYKKEIIYGMIIPTIQEVVDFLLGHSVVMEKEGFEFNGRNYDGSIQNWKTSVKEFVAWTLTTNSDAIALSPGAKTLEINSSYSVLNALSSKQDNFMVFRGDGGNLDSSKISINRTDPNHSVINTHDDMEGNYGSELELIQKEHVLLLNNFTEFNDIIYNQITGFRQPRLKVNGYRTVNWDGSLNIGGFIYDDCQITKWEPWKEYNIGDTVKYKEFYYTAKTKVHGDNTFNSKQWILLPEKPENGLLPNFEYKINQFEDFYSLDTDNFDKEQQKFAQHLIGYQPRKYLKNIITDDVSQYKAYQGYIAEKGNKNAIKKIFNPLSGNITIDEEWAIKIGEYGALNGLKEFTFYLNHNKSEPQTLKILDNKKYYKNKNALTQYFDKKETVFYSENDSNLMPISDEKFLLPNIGKVNQNQVDAILPHTHELLQLNDINDLKYIWITENEDKWDVIKQTLTQLHITSIIKITKDYIIVEIKNNNLTVGDIIIVKNSKSFDGKYEVIEITENENVKLFVPNKQNIEVGPCFANIIKYESCRVNNIDQANENITLNEHTSNKLWIDNTTNGWQVIQKNDNFEYTNIIKNQPINPQNVLSNITMQVDYNNSRMAIGRPDDGRGTVYVYYRRSNTSEFKISQIIQAESHDYGYGDNVLLSRNNEYMVVSHSTATVGGTILAGKVDVYKRFQNNRYELYKELFSENPMRGDNFGYEICFHETNNEIKLFILSKRPNGGKVHIFKEGTFDGIHYDWEPNQDKRYKGEFDETIPYNDGDIVIHNKDAYQAITNVNPSNTLSDEHWEVIKLGYDVTNIIDTSNHLDFISSRDDTYQVKKICTSEDGELLATYKSSGGKGGIVVIYKNINGHYTPIQKINNDNIEFGYAINEYKGTLVISSPYEYDTKDTVFIYKKNKTEYSLHQQLYMPYWNNFKRFGTKIEQSDNYIAITSEQGKNNQYTKLDNGLTTFDFGFCRFKEDVGIVGAVNLYQKSNDYYIYAQSINFNNEDNESLSLSKLVNDNIIHIGSTRNTEKTQVCDILEYRIKNYCWNVIGEYKPTVDVSLVKNVALFDSITGRLKQELDFIDVYQGKLANIANERLSYISAYDPAVYVMGDEKRVHIDPTSCWLEQNVGKLWWDLSSSKFLFPYQDNITFSATTWNNEIYSNSVDIYEWVESVLKPSEWDKKSENPTGEIVNITGKSKYGDLGYSTRKKYDSVSKTFTTYYYYWVRNKKTTTDDNILSAQAIANLISNPASIGYKFFSFISPTEFALHNCDDIIDDNTLLKIQFWENNSFKNSTIHNEYKLITENIDNSFIDKSIKDKWYDSLIGQDINGKIVPDPSLREDAKYGNLFYPRQSWFKNRIEALKQIINYTNNILKQHEIIDKKDISNLFQKEDEPTIKDNLYDVEVDSINDLPLVNIYRYKLPVLELNIENGKIINVIVIDPGDGYITPPTLTVDGIGNGAVFDVTLNNTGGINTVNIINTGEYYSEKDKLIIREFSVLVKCDETRNNKWSIYSFSSKTKQWNISRIQQYNVQEYWEYIDWYAPGYDKNTHIDYLIDDINLLHSENFENNVIVKIKNVGIGGWQLVHKQSETKHITVGREKGTIYFKKKLHDPSEFKIKYDSISYDNSPYDLWPYKELRIILNTLRDKILINELKVFYNKLFFSSIYYVLTENTYVDWIFKTSFVKIKYGQHELKQDNMFKVDNSVNYEEYIKEVKPFKTKIREYVTSYDTVDVSTIKYDDFEVNKSDFNYYKPIVKDGTLPIDIIKTNVDSWYNNRGYRIKSILIEETSQIFNSIPIVKIEGECTQRASAKCVLADDGTIDKIDIIDGGNGYIKKPNVILLHNNTELDIKIVPVLGQSCWRVINNKIKFDRVGIESIYNDTYITETINIDNDDNFVMLKWPITTKRDQIFIHYNGHELIQSDYVYENVVDNTKTYKRFLGKITFNFIPDNNSIIEVIYKRNIDIMFAADRIKNFYTQTLRQYPKNISTLMTGVEFGGINISGGEFLGDASWGIPPWMTNKWLMTSNDNDYYDSIIEGGTTDFGEPPNKEYSVTYQGTDFNGIHNPGPEELVTGTVSEAYHIKIYEQNVTNGWSYFKDNTNTTHYKRIKEKTTLKKDLKWDDDVIELYDNINGPVPGVIFINKERIIYHEKNNNILSNLIRGTYGTSIPNNTPIGTEVIEQGIDETIPYDDNVINNTIEFNGRYAYMLPFLVDSEDVIEVYLGGRKLRKNEIAMYNPEKGLDSPEADDAKGPEFTVVTNPGYDSFSLDMVEYSLSPTILGDSGYSLLVLNPQNLMLEPVIGDKISIIKKEGIYWHKDGKSISNSSSGIATFIKG